MHRYSLWGLELWRFARSRITRGALVMLLLLPLLYSGLYLWSFWDPYSRLDRVPVALVEADRGTTVHGRPVHAGRDLERALIKRHTFDWHVASPAQARQGVQAGRYYMSLEIPPDFSARLASPNGAHPRAGVLQLTTNDANNYVVSSISRAAFAEVRAAASVKTAHGYLDRIFISFGNLHDAIGRAAGGAGRLAAGLDDAHAGSRRLAAGSAQLAGGGRRLADGSGRLADGLGRAAAGSRRLADGLGRLETGSAALARGAGRVAAGTGELAGRVNDVAGHVLPALAGNAGDVAAAAGAVADAAAFVAGSAGRLQVATGPVAAGADRGHQAVQAAIAEADAQHPGQPHPALDAALAATATVAGLAHDADTVASADAARLSQLQQQARQVETTARRIQADAPGLATRARRALAQINRLNAGAHQVAAGAARLSAGASSAAGGARELAGGVARLHAGALQLQAGLGKLSAGADRLSDGARRLDDGIARLAAGAHELADRLARGARRIPKYGPQQRDQRAGVMSDPVQLAKTALNPAVNYGTGFAPYFIPLSLWVGAMVGFTLLRALSDRALASNAAPWRVALIGFAPATFMGALQAVVLLLVLHFLIGLDMARPLAVMAFLVLTVMCFTAINQLLVARFGPGGRLLSIVLLLLQLTSAGGTYPVETSPPFFGAIHPFMPMSYVVRALRHLISGGDLAPVWQACAVLGAFVVASLVLTSMTARRRRVWTVQRLHPELAV